MKVKASILKVWTNKTKIENIFQKVPNVTDT